MFVICKSKISLQNCGNIFMFCVVTLDILACKCSLDKIVHNKIKCEKIVNPHVISWY